MQSVNQGSIISVRTSDARFQTLSSGGRKTEQYQQQSVLYSNQSHTNAWIQTSLPVISSRKTISFVEIHAETAENMTAPFQSITPRQNSGRGPGSESVGEVPVGDMIIPMLVIALGYVVIKLFRNRKISQAL